MEKLTNIKQLKRGDKFYLVKGENFVEYEFLCEHPHNPMYILAIDSMTQNAPKLYIPTICDENGGYYIGELDETFLYEQRLKYYEEEIEDIKRIMLKLTKERNERN